MIRHGCDVSDDQGAIEWWAAADHIDFAYIQIAYATPSAPVVTSFGAANVRRALDQGLAVGAYFFALPLPGAAEEQGAVFGRLVAEFGDLLTLPAAVDVETNPAAMPPRDLTQWVRDFLGATRLDARRLAVYTDPGFWEANTDGTPINAHLWVAAWGAPAPPRLKGLPAAFMWQTTARGRVPGITGPVDLDTLIFVPDTQADPHDQRPPANWQDLPGGEVLRPPGQA